MTTAARPTYYAAIGKQETVGSTISHHRSGKNQIAHTKMKFRQPGQSTAEEMKEIDLVQELNKNEQNYELAKNKMMSTLIQEEKNVNVALMLKNKPETDLNELKNKYDDADVDEEDSNDGFDSSSDESDDEDDDEEELQRELMRIRQEKEATQARKQQEDEELLQRKQQDNAMNNNPMQHIEENSAKIKRRWNDDVVFRNQARDEPQVKKRFVNDTIRSDFHRSFLRKFIK